MSKSAPVAKAWREFGERLVEALALTGRRLLPLMVDVEVASGVFPERYAEALAEPEEDVFV